MLKKITLSLSLLTISFSGFTQTKKEAIKELFSVMQTDSLVEKSLNAMIPIMTQQLNNSAGSSNNEQRTKVIMDAAKSVVIKLRNEEMVALYDKYFTEQEINEFLTFYRTPAGQKIIRVLPDIQKEIMSSMMVKYLPEMQKTIVEALSSDTSTAPATKPAPAPAKKAPAPAKKN